jgi:citrate synthase
MDELTKRLQNLHRSLAFLIKGEKPLPSDDKLPHAANFLWELQGMKPDMEMARDLDVCLLLHADHTFNASTFACREVVSTRAHLYITSWVFREIS